MRGSDVVISIKWLIHHRHSQTLRLPAKKETVTTCRLSQCLRGRKIKNILSKTFVIGAKAREDQRVRLPGHTESCLPSAHDSMRLSWPPMWWVNSTGWGRKRRKMRKGWKTRGGGGGKLEWTNWMSKRCVRHPKFKQPWPSLVGGV